jgi:uncharacterized delta-60 repeat protein
VGSRRPIRTIRISRKPVRIAGVCSVVCILFAALALGSVRAYAAPGMLDPSFGAGGMVITAFPGFDAAIGGVTLQPDGKIVAAGWRQSGTTTEGVVARYLSNGTPDPSFGANGTAIIPNAFYSAVALQPDGRIVAAGTVAHYPFGVIVSRLRSDGTLDPAFGAGGSSIVSSPTSTMQASALAIQPDGRIIAAGGAVPTPSQVLAVRFDAAGNLDPSFGAGGIVRIWLGNGFQAYARGVALQPAGKILLTTIDGSANLQPVLLRLDNNGSIDSTFGTAGLVNLPAVPMFLGTGSTFSSIGLRADGRIVAAGYAGGYPAHLAAAQVLPNGVLDPTFGSAGAAMASAEAIAYGTGMCFTPSGKIIVAGSTSPGGPPFDAMIARFTTTGILDSTFGTAGVVVTTVLGDDFVYGVACQLDNKIVAVGSTTSAGGQSQFLLLRYDATDLAPPGTVPVPAVSAAVLLVLATTVLLIGGLSIRISRHS